MQMTTGENDRSIEEVNQGLGNMSLNLSKNGWEGLTVGYITGDGSRREWATWSGKKTDDEQLMTWPKVIMGLSFMMPLVQNVPLSIELICDALEVDDKKPDASCMLGDLELKNDDWVKPKDKFRAAKDASNGKDSYATLCLGNWNYFAAVRSEKRAHKLEVTHLEKSKELYTKI